MNIVASGPAGAFRGRLLMLGRHPPIEHGEAATSQPVYLDYSTDERG